MICMSLKTISTKEYCLKLDVEGKSAFSFLKVDKVRVKTKSHRAPLQSTFSNFCNTEQNLVVF